MESPIATAGLVSTFSSYGTDAELNLKPDVSAPGGSIFSTWPHQQFGGHNSISGTSVLFNGTPAPLLYVSAGQVSAIVPYNVGGATAQVVVQAANGSTPPFPLTVAASAASQPRPSSSPCY